MNNYRALALGVFFAFAATTAALASGMFPGLPSYTTESDAGVSTGGLTGLERMPADTQNVNGINNATVYVTPDSLYAGALVTDSTASGITGTAAQFSGYPLMYVRLTGAISGATNVQLPTAASMYAVWNARAPYNNATNGASSKCWFIKIINAAGTGSGVWTATTNTGLTLSGNMTVAVGGSRLLKACFTSSTAASITDYGN